MSLDASRWAWQQKLRASLKLVLLALADRANEDHTCFPGIARMAKDTGLNRQTIMAAFAALEQSGLLSIERRPGHVSLYHLNGVPERHQYENPDQSENSDQCEKPDRTSAEKHTATSVETRTQNLSIEPISNRTRRNAPKSVGAIAFDANAIRFVGITPEQMAAWERAFPAVSIEAETARAAAWLNANPKNRKANYARFLANWLSRVQDRAPPVQTVRQPGKLVVVV